MKMITTKIESSRDNSSQQVLLLMLQSTRTVETHLCLLSLICNTLDTYCAAGVYTYLPRFLNFLGF